MSRISRKLLIGVGGLFILGTLGTTSAYLISDNFSNKVDTFINGLSNKEKITDDTANSIDNGDVVEKTYRKCFIGGDSFSLFLENNNLINNQVRVYENRECNITINIYNIENNMVGYCEYDFKNFDFEFLLSYDEKLFVSYQQSLSEELFSDSINDLGFVILNYYVGMDMGRISFNIPSDLDYSNYRCSISIKAYNEDMSDFFESYKDNILFNSIFRM